MLCAVSTSCSTTDHQILKSLFQLVVVAEDFGEPALRDAAKVLINIDDVNDVIPNFEQDELR